MKPEWAILLSYKLDSGYGDANRMHIGTQLIPGFRTRELAESSIDVVKRNISKHTASYNVSVDVIQLAGNIKSNETKEPMVSL